MFVVAVASRWPGCVQERVLSECWVQLLKWAYLTAGLLEIISSQEKSSTQPKSPLWVNPIISRKSAKYTLLELTWKWRMAPWKTIFHYKQVVVHFHVSPMEGIQILQCSKIQLIHTFLCNKVEVNLQTGGLQPLCSKWMAWPPE